MSCSNPTSIITLQLDKDECFLAFEFAKATCGKRISAQTGYNDYCQGKTLQDILSISFQQLVESLKINAEEMQFILYLEWDALRCVIAQYLGVEDEAIDKDRCHVAAIHHDGEETLVELMIFPPKDLPEVLPCHSKNQ